jgi:hypothetical protein
MTEPTFQPIEPNPYIVGNPVRNPKMFFGREAEFQTVQHNFMKSEDGLGLVFVFCGERRSGKTSILFQIRDGRLGEQFVPVLIDMQAMVIKSESDFFALITDEIFGTLGPAAAGLQSPDYGVSNPPDAFRRFVEQLCAMLKQKGQKLVLLFDEYELMEDKVAGGQLGEGVFRMFGHLIEHRPVFFVFTGSQHLGERQSKSEVWTLLSRSQFERITYLKRSDAETLITRPVKGRVHYAAGTVDRIHRLTAGHPFYTQWVCQNLVDHLNEHETNVADPETLAAATKTLITNPPPEMARLWGDLGSDQKLTLALLAEVLDDENEFTTPERLARVAKRSYRVKGIDVRRIAGAASELFTQEFLLQSSDDKVRHAFRMDLWRIWIRHQHTVWKVIHEESFEVVPRVRWAAILSGTFVMLIILAAGYLAMESRSHDEPPDISGGESPPAMPPPAKFRLEAQPRSARISMNGLDRGRGIAVIDDLPPSEIHEVSLTAAGYHDSSIALELQPGESRRLEVSLRPQLGSLRVRSDPAGASVGLNGEIRGTTPVTIDSLPVIELLELEVSLEGYLARSRTIRVSSDSTVTAEFDLARRAFETSISTTPVGAVISIDGTPLERRSPTTARLTEGSHHIVARLEDYIPLDSLLVVSDASPLILLLKPVPPGALVVQGLRPAAFYFDGDFIVDDMYNSGREKLRPGLHEVRVELAGPIRAGQTGAKVIERTIEVRSGQLTIFDFENDTIEFESLPPDSDE